MHNEDLSSCLSVDKHRQYCSLSDCFSCLIKEPNPAKRKIYLVTFFKDLPNRVNEGEASIIDELWSFAMARPNDPELVELGVFECMSTLMWKGIKNRSWLVQGQNISTPYYAAHIIGSYTMNMEKFAIRAVKEGVIPPLVELLRGRLTWVEQRVAVRALGHIAAYDSTFPSIVGQEDVLELAMELAVSSLEIVYTHFIQSEERRLWYHCDLLTRRMGGHEIECRKAEEWASQLQCWSLQLINCFAFRERYLSTICKPGFLTKLQSMWGGLVNEKSPAGVGLLRTICHHKCGRRSMAAYPSIVKALCNVARSSDDWQCMAVDCLLLFLRDAETREQVMDTAAVALVDLADLSSLGDRKKVGSLIMEVLLEEDTQCPSPLRSSLSTRTRLLLNELANQQQRIKWEKSMAKEDLLVKQHAALVLKLEGNSKFSAGDVMGATAKYSEALALCPMRARKERVVLHSNRAQCFLLLQEPEAAISDTTRALCLHKPVNCHGKSLWRRAQAYDMMGLAKESLLDAIMFVHEGSNGKQEDNQPAVPDYAERLIRKQMQITWLFREAAIRHGGIEQETRDQEVKARLEEDEGNSDWETASESEEDIEELDDCDANREERERQASLQELVSSLKELATKQGGKDKLPTSKKESSPSSPPQRDLASGNTHPGFLSLDADAELLKKGLYDLIQAKYARKRRTHMEDS